MYVLCLLIVKLHSIKGNENKSKKVTKFKKTIQNQYECMCAQHMLFLAYVSAYVSGGASYAFAYVFL